MRLLSIQSDGEISLTADLIGNVPPYAILSHTWGPDVDEVTFTEMSVGSGKNKVGYHKIRFCGEQAARDGLEYFWVDTCCIDKSNSTELSEALNSMFRWYRNSEQCYVYLADISSTPAKFCTPTLKTSRWFTRGWTLQELIAPRNLVLFSCNGIRLGDRRFYRELITRTTAIPLEALLGEDLSHYSYEQILGWAEHRQTKREEDKAYSLMGMFDVYLPLIYGEGETHALRRLRSEVERRTQPSSRTLAQEPHETLDTIPLHRNGSFFGRNDLLEALHATLDQEGGDHATAHKSCVLSGIGGSGKTQIALEYAYRHRDLYQYVFWVRCLAQDYRKIATVLGLTKPNISIDDKEVQTEVRKWFSKKGNKWLLIFDSVTTAQTFQPYIPTGCGGSIIYTTQSVNLPTFSRTTIQVEPFPPEEGGRLLLSYLPDAPSQQDQMRMAVDLARTLGGLPLAIAHIADFVMLSTLQDVVTFFETRDSGSQVWYSPPGPSTAQYERSLGVVFDVALDCLTADARDLIECMAFLSPDSLSESLVFHDGSSSGLSLASSKFRDMRLRKALVEQSLLQRSSIVDDEPALLMNRALRLALFFKLDQTLEIRQKRFDQATQLVRRVFPHHAQIEGPDSDLWLGLHGNLAHILNLHAEYKMYDKSLLPSLALAGLLSDASDYLYQTGRAAYAVRVLATAIGICRHGTVSGTDESHLVCTGILDIMALCELQESGKMRAPGLAHSIKVVELRKEYNATKPESEVTVSDQLLIVVAMDNLAEAYLECGEWHKAEGILMQAIKLLREWTTEKDTPYLFARVYRNFAVTQQSDHLFDGAVEYIERAAALINPAKYGPWTKISLDMQFACAITLGNCGQQAEALAKHSEVLSGRRLLLGGSSQPTLDSYYAAGTIHAARGRLSDAEELIRASLQSKNPGYEANTARSMFQLSQLLERRGEYDEARRLRLEARELRDTLVSPDCPCPGVNLDEKDEEFIYDRLVPLGSGRTIGILEVRHKYES